MQAGLVAGLEAQLLATREGMARHTHTNALLYKY